METTADRKAPPAALYAASRPAPSLAPPRAAASWAGDGAAYREVLLGPGERLEVAPGVWVVNRGRQARRRRRARDGELATLGAARIGIDAPRDVPAVLEERWRRGTD